MFGRLAEWELWVARRKIPINAALVMLAIPPLPRFDLLLLLGEFYSAPYLCQVFGSSHRWMVRPPKFLLLCRWSISWLKSTIFGSFLSMPAENFLDAFVVGRG